MLKRSLTYLTFSSELPPKALEKSITPSKLDIESPETKEAADKNIVIKLFENEGTVGRMLEMDAETLNSLTEVTKYANK